MVIENLAVDLDAVAHRAQDVDDRAPDRRLAAARLADQAERFALIQHERHAVDGVHFTRPAQQQAAEDGEPDVQVLNFEDGRHACLAEAPEARRWVRR